MALASPLDILFDILVIPTYFAIGCIKISNSLEPALLLMRPSGRIFALWL